MRIVGDSLIDFEPFYRVGSIDEIKKTPPNSVVLFGIDSEIAKYCKENLVKFAIVVNDMTQLIYAYNYGADFIVVPKEIAKQAVSFADDYLIDAKIVLVIEKKEELIEAANSRVDIALFKEGIADADI